ncbi:hypothetical protein [Candidatus Leptofilum sp.]|uniref:hypothetical protein n=1 Tax=Candidatus Leptofilum sp. TaxID=3241576 RepID=UPI003B5972C2
MNKETDQHVPEWAVWLKDIDIIAAIIIIIIGLITIFLFENSLTGISFTLSIVVVYLATIRPVVRKPRLTFFIDKVRCSAPTEQGDTASWFMRLGIVNYGLTAADKCVGRIVSIWTETGEQLEKFDPLTLYWARQDGNHTGFSPINIQGYYDFEYLDIGQVKQNNLTPITLRVVLEPPMILSKGGNNSPSPGSTPSLRPGTYFIRVAVYAEEANIPPTWLEITCSEKISECGEFVPCSIRRGKPNFV